MSTKKRRRGHGEGSIYQRQNGRWVACLDLGNIDGKRKRIVRYADTRKEAAEKLREMQRQHEQGVNLGSERQTVGEYLDQWMEERVSQLAESTQETYGLYVRLYLKPHLGSVQLVKLTPDRVQRMVNTVTKQSTAHNARYCIHVLKSALSTAEKRGFVSRNVAQFVDLPAVEPYKAAFFTVEQAKRFLDAAQGSRYNALYRVALSLGLRQKELIELTWDDIDFEDKTLKVSKSKTPSGVRKLALPAVLVEVLKEHQQQIRLKRLATGAKWSENNLVFPSDVGKHAWACNIRRDFRDVLQKAGLPRIRFHDLRHSCASFLLAEGVQPKVVSEILGHSNISITMNTYAHVMEETQREAVEKVAGLFA